MKNNVLIVTIISAMLSAFLVTVFSLNSTPEKHIANIYYFKDELTGCHYLGRTQQLEASRHACKRTARSFVINCFMRVVLIQNKPPYSS